MISTREQIVDMMFSLSEEQLEQLRKWVNENTEFEENTKVIMNKVIDNTLDDRRSEEKGKQLNTEAEHEGF